MARVRPVRITITVEIDDVPADHNPHDLAAETALVLDEALAHQMSVGKYPRVDLIRLSGDLSWLGGDREED